MANEANASGFQGIKDLTIIPSDFLNNFGAATSSAAASMSSRDWGVHNNTIDLGGGSSLSLKQFVLWGGVSLLGWYIIRKIRGK